VAEKKFLDFLDRFDGGGMGKSGEKFEGGGLLSMLGNLFADPYGSDDKARMASRDAFYNAQGDAVPAPTLLAPRAGGNAGVETSLRPQARPQSVAERGMGLDPFGGAGPNVSGAAAERGMGLDPFGGAGPNVSGAAAERGMGLDPFGGFSPNSAGPFNPSSAAPVQPVAPGMPTGLNMSQTPDADIVQGLQGGLPASPSRGADPSYGDPLSPMGFDRYLLEKFDPQFVNRVRMNPEQYNTAYDVYVRNGGRLN